MQRSESVRRLIICPVGNLPWNFNQRRKNSFAGWGQTIVPLVADSHIVAATNSSQYQCLSVGSKTGNRAHGYWRALKNPAKAGLAPRVNLVVYAKDHNDVNQTRIAERDVLVSVQADFGTSFPSQK